MHISDKLAVSSEVHETQSSTKYRSKGDDGVTRGSPGSTLPGTIDSAAARVPALIPARRLSKSPSMRPIQRIKRNTILVVTATGVSPLFRNYEDCLGIIICIGCCHENIRTLFLYREKG